jgi:hypothetical protein
MGKPDFQQQYNDLFSSESEKAKAFDKIAEQYYYGNFGRMQKADFETLIFSLYLDRILNKSEQNMLSYSDYTLSKYLGITQSKISNLKVKKELQYPYEGFDWRKSFYRIASKACYENGKIRINIPDKNLYYELKNAIEEKGGYVDVQLNSSLLQIRPEYFIDLLLDIGNETDRKSVRKKLKNEMKEKNIDVEFMDRYSTGEVIKENAISIGVDVIADIVSSAVPVAGKTIANIIKNSIA